MSKNWDLVRFLTLWECHTNKEISTMKSCYDCKGYTICRLRYALEQALRDHSGMLNDDYAGIAAFPNNIALFCIKFEKEAEVKP